MKPKKQSSSGASQKELKRLLQEQQQQLDAMQREKEIETALEDIRSRSLSMHKSDELKDVVSLVFEKLRELKVAMDSACILTFTDDLKGHLAWAANPDLFSVSSVYVPYHNDPISSALLNSRKKGELFLHKSWKAKEKNQHWNYLFKNTEYGNLPDELKKAVLDFEGWGFTGPFFQNSATLLVSYQERQYSENEREIIKRVGTVFEQSYIRFLDLQKAEAQAREAQIEASLERIRGQAMALNDSHELSKVVGTILSELKKLGYDLFECNIMLVDRERELVTSWVASHSSELPTSYQIPHFDHPFIHQLFKDLKNRESLSEQQSCPDVPSQ